MSKRALAGGYGPAQKDGRTQPRKKASQTPLAFALAFMRDEAKPDALRAGMAKAVLPYLHKRGQEQEKEQEQEHDDAPAKEPMSDLEAARRIAHILERGRLEQEGQAKEATTAAPAVPPRSPSAHAPPAPRPRDAAPTPRTAWPDDDAAQSREIYPDPHAGYWWIR